MKNRYAILLIVIVEIIVYLLTTGPDFLGLRWFIGKFCFTAGVFTILLTLIQKQKGYTFHRLFSKGLKIGLFFIIIYIPVSTLTNYWWVEIEGTSFSDKLKYLVNDFIEDIPILIVSFLLRGIATFAQVLIGTCVGYLVWDKLLKTEA